MKKLSAAVALCLALSAAAFSLETELSASVGITPVSVVNVNGVENLKSAGDTQDLSLALSRGFGLGLDAGATFYLISPIDKDRFGFDFGINAGAGFTGSFGGDTSLSAGTRDYTLSPFGFRVYVGAGPAARFNFGANKKHSVFVAPLIRGTFIGGAELSAALNLGYRLWLKEFSPKLKLGLTVGADLGFPIIGQDHLRRDGEDWTRNLNYAGGFAAKIFVGAVLNIGSSGSSGSDDSDGGAERSPEEEANLDAALQSIERNNSKISGTLTLGNNETVDVSGVDLPAGGSGTFRLTDGYTATYSLEGGTLSISSIDDGTGATGGGEGDAASAASSGAFTVNDGATGTEVKTADLNVEDGKISGRLILGNNSTVNVSDVDVPTEGSGTLELADGYTATYTIEDDTLSISDIEGDGASAASSVTRIVFAGNPNATGTQVRSAELEVERGIEVERTARGMMLRVENLTFEPDSAALVAGQEGTLSQIASVLSTVPESRFLVEGHTASTGADDDPEADRALSLSRAQTVVAELAARGIPESSFTAEGAGSSRPLADNTDPARNRRVEVTILN